MDFRQYDNALGRFMYVDPITEKYEYMTPYQFDSNNPVWKIELEGLEGFKFNNKYVKNVLEGKRFSDYRSPVFTLGRMWRRSGNRYAEENRFYYDSEKNLFIDDKAIHGKKVKSHQIEQMLLEEE